MISANSIQWVTLIAAVIAAATSILVAYITYKMKKKEIAYTFLSKTHDKLLDLRQNITPPMEERGKVNKSLPDKEKDQFIFDIQMNNIKAADIYRMNSYLFPPHERKMLDELDRDFRSNAMKEDVLKFTVLSAKFFDKLRGALDDQINKVADEIRGS